MKFFRLILFCGCHHTAESPVMPCAMRKNKEFVVCMERDEILNLCSTALKFLPPPEDKDPFNEVLPQGRVLKTAVILNRHEREAFHERPCKNSDTCTDRNARRIVYFYPPH